jgi:hypothetical protein
MPYRVTGIGLTGPLTYLTVELWDAAYTAAKMSDQGVEDVHVYDDEGREVDMTDAPLPPGWRHGPFKRSDFP